MAILLRGSHGGQHIGTCTEGGGHTEDTETARIKRNLSKGYIDFEKEEVMSSWVILAAPSATPPAQRVSDR